MELINKPTQRRSQETQDGIIRAFRQSLATTSYDAIAISDLARRAGISVGGFYARFSSKDALLLPLIEDTIAEFRAKLSAALDEADRADGGLASIASAYVNVMVSEFRRHGPVLQQVARNARGDVATAVAERVFAFNEFSHGRFRELAWARRVEIKRKPQRSAIEVALFIASAAARDGVVDGNWRSYAIHPSDAVLIRDITATMVAYLTVRSGS